MKVMKVSPLFTLHHQLWSFREVQREAMKVLLWCDVVVLGVGVWCSFIEREREKLHLLALHLTHACLCKHLWLVSVSPRG